MATASVLVHKATMSGDAAVPGGLIDPPESRAWGKDLGTISLFGKCGMQNSKDSPPRFSILNPGTVNMMKYHERITLI